jgi:hypothetical protein
MASRRDHGQLCSADNEITSASAFGQVELECQVAGFGDSTGGGTTDMLVRDTQTGTFEAYDITNIQLIGAPSLGASRLGLAGRRHCCRSFNILVR